MLAAGNLAFAGDEAAEANAFEVNYGYLVTATGTDGAGSGFIAEMSGRRFLVTNTHVLAADPNLRFETAQGQVITPSGSVFVSRERDLAIIPIAWDGDYARVDIEKLPQGTSIGDEVVVLGNSEGAGVITQLDGELTGIGPDRIEVDAEFVPGNSGSPIIHKPSGSVIGIASYLRVMDRSAPWHDRAKEDSKTRRFGFRLDGNIQWDAVTIADFHRQASEFNDFVDRTEALADLIYHLVFERQVRTGYRTHPTLGRVVADVGDDFYFGRGLTPANRQVLDRFIMGLKRELRRDHPGSLNLTLQYFRDKVEPFAKVREEAFLHIDGFEG
ncbi:MAG: serine protease [Opitutales bacterium]